MTDRRTLIAPYTLNVTYPPTPNGEPVTATETSDDWMELYIKGSDLKRRDDSVYVTITDATGIVIIVERNGHRRQR